MEAKQSQLPFITSCNQPPTSRIVVNCLSPVGVEASWLWCLWRKSFSDFPKQPSAFLHPECSLGAVRPHKTRNSTILCSPIVPMPGSLCVSIRVLRHLLLRHSSSNRARAGSGASCTIVVGYVEFLRWKGASHSSVHRFFFVHVILLSSKSAAEVLNPRALIP